MSKLIVFETFAGIGSQTKALKNIKADFEVVATSEWYIDAIIGYNAVHHNKFKKIKREDSLKFLEDFTISADSKKHVHSTQRFSDEKLSNIVSSIKVANNLGSILDIKGKDVPEHDLLTYSFPCQDLSIAGKGKGLSRDSGTRSSLMWEVFRILEEINESKNNLPNFLVMENVPAIQNVKYKERLDHFKDSLSDLGYENHYEVVLTASNLGIPQRIGDSLDNREAEYFFGCLKSERLNHIETHKMKIEEITEIITEYVEWYNTKRIQSKLQWKTPTEVSTYAI